MDDVSCVEWRIVQNLFHFLQIVFRLEEFIAHISDRVPYIFSICLGFLSVDVWDQFGYRGVQIDCALV